MVFAINFNSFNFSFIKKRKFENIPFSTLRFFKSIEDKSINKINLINILLLIIRTLIILFIILLLSRPVINGKYSNRLDNNSTLLIFCIDNSFSNKTFLNTSLNDVIDKISSSYNDKTFIKIIRMSDNKIIYDKVNEGRMTISNRLPISYAPISFNNVLNHNIFDDKNDIFSRKDIFIFSDLNSDMFMNIDEDNTVNPFDQADTFETEGTNLLDFTEDNPFGEF